MINKIYKKYKSEGIITFLLAIFSHIYPLRLKYFPYIKKNFESKIGFEIGGPSSIFNKRNIIPVYDISNRIDNCNYKKNTIWNVEIIEGNTYIFNSKKNQVTSTLAKLLI